MNAILRFALTVPMMLLAFCAAAADPPPGPERIARALLAFPGVHPEMRLKSYERGTNGPTSILAARGGWVSYRAHGARPDSQDLGSSSFFNGLIHASNTSVPLDLSVTGDPYSMRNENSFSYVYREKNVLPVLEGNWCCTWAIGESTERTTCQSIGVKPASETNRAIPGSAMHYRCQTSSTPSNYKNEYELAWFPGAGHFLYLGNLPVSRRVPNDHYPTIHLK